MDELTRNVESIMYVSYVVGIFIIGSLIKRIAYYEFTKRYYEIAIDMTCFDKKIEWNDRKGCQNFNMLLISTMVAFDFCEIIRSVCILATGEQTFIITMKKFET